MHDHIDRFLKRREHYNFSFIQIEHMNRIDNMQMIISEREQKLLSSALNAIEILDKSCKHHVEYHTHADAHIHQSIGSSKRNVKRAILSLSMH